MRTILVTTLVFCLAALLEPPAAWAAQENVVTPEKRLEEAMTNLRDWFDSLLSHIDSVVAQEDRRRLADKLEPLESKLFRFEWDKRDLIEAIAAPEFNEGRVADAASRLDASLSEVRAVLRDNGLPLRKEWKEKGDKVETDLEDALGVRKGWINDLRLKLRRQEPFDRVAIAKEGEEARKRLEEASVALTKLITKLRE